MHFILRCVFEDVLFSVWLVIFWRKRLPTSERPPNGSAANGRFSFSISGQNGPDYAIETSTKLPQWSTVFITNRPVLPFTWTDANSGVPLRFYRVKLSPPLP